MSRLQFAARLMALTMATASIGQAEEGPLDSWRADVRIREVAPDIERHTIHSYFNTCPESPDGRHVLFFASTKSDAHYGEVRIRDRATGEERVLAKDVSVEDAHRVACQQWVSNGRRVTFHGERGGEWFVAAVDVDSATERVLARGRLSGWGQPHSDLVPLYGPHWNPGPHRDLELLNVETGEIRKVVTADAVKTAYPDWHAKAYGDKPTSIFFPVLSPDLSRVFFKMASPSGGDARSTAASQRQGLVCYSLADQRFLFLRERWGHPAWHPDKKTIVEMAYTLIDSDTGKEQRMPGLPAFRGDHPSASPDGKLIVTDTTMDRLGGDAKDWGIVVADASGKDYVLIHQFNNSRGASSWRRSHPHPVFSSDGRRIYFNVSHDRWTRLFVAEIAEPKDVPAKEPDKGTARPRRVLLRSSWQTVNIGDIAHTPGMLALLEKHLPDAEVRLWPNKLSDDVTQMLKARFPKLKLVTSTDAQQTALAECDFCLHGSGPGLVGAAQLKSWQATGKAYGFGGVTLNDAELKDHRSLLEGAKFVFCRDTQSLSALQASGVTGPTTEFGPDATFLLDLRDDAKAEAFLKEHSLEARKFACFVPRLRWTPYWKEGRKYAEGEVARREAENEKFREADHAKLRTAIIAWVRETGHKALLCPEMTYQVELLKPLLFDPLPEDVKPHVVVRPKYWLTDEAASTYARAAVVVSFEMHSPIIAIANGTPAIHLRQPTDTRKGQMWRDVGLGDWLFEIDETAGEQIAAKLLSIHGDPKSTAATVAQAREFTAARGRRMIDGISINARVEK